MKRNVYCSHSWNYLEIKGFFGNVILEYFRCVICRSIWVHKVNYEHVYQKEPKKIIGIVNE